MGSDVKYRLELVPARLIKRMPGLSLGASREGAGKARDIARERGHCWPFVLSDSQGCMTLLAGAAAFEASLEGKAAKIPAVIVQTEGEADSLLFALQSAQLEEAPSAVAVGAAIARLVDAHGVPRKRIAETLGRSPAWISRMESLGRKLNVAVRDMVSEGQVAPRAAQEIARLPDDVQATFAVSASGEFLSKQSIARLVSRYLNEDTGAEERDRIVRTPGLALPNGPERRGGAGRDSSDSARLSRAIARCLDDASFLSGLLGRAGPGVAGARAADAIALADSLDALQRRLRDMVAPGKNKNGGGDG
jgi:ParB-like chromosome segregation protein Spo0J